MEHFSDKMQIFFRPFVIINIIFTPAYTLLHWLLIKQWHLFEIEEDMVGFIVPIVLVWLPVLIWLLKGTKIFAKDSFYKSQPRFAMLAFAWMAILAPAVAAQSYLESVTGKMTQLNDVSAMQAHPVTRYYALQHYYIDKTGPAICSLSRVQGNHNEKLDLLVYAVAPVLTDSNDKTTPAKAWYGILYSKVDSNRKSENANAGLLNEYTKQCLVEFDTTDVNRFVYLENIGNVADRAYFVYALKLRGVNADNNTVILLPQNEPFAAHNGHKLLWVFGLYALGTLVVFLLLLTIKIDEYGLAMYK